MQSIRITTAQNIDIDYEIAGLGARILARLIDWGIFIALFIAIISLNLIGDRASKLFQTGIPIIMVIYFLIYVLYDLICEVFFNGQSVGKRIMKIRVISLDGAQPSLGQYLMRWIFRIVDFGITFQVGGLIAAVSTEKNQRIGDMVAGTVLVQTTPSTKFDQVGFAPISGNYKPVFSEASLLTNSEVVLIHEVLQNFKISDNYPLVYSTATRLKKHLNIVSPVEMDDLTFLQTLITDYNYAAIHAEA
ncbi:MAG TPA: RDD family protein [Pedobacter sp.]|jgi:uncharacterized RDD family membrane protein YckC